ncbi:baseplate tail-tube junction protein [Aeromonas dhakensis]|uniref:baseplate tail-tube junction protein n=1 Tax=Aeromonas dhakensis TaxID=196024 RepID=UPI0038CF8669
MAEIKVLNQFAEDMRNSISSKIRSGIQLVSDAIYTSDDSTNSAPAHGGIVALQYPMSMAGNSEQWKGAPCLCFTIFTDLGAGFSKLKSFQPYSKQVGFTENMKKEETQAIILLPMPVNGLTDRISNNIGAGDNSFVQELIAAGIDGGRSGSGFMDTLKKTGTAVFNTVKVEAGVMVDKASMAYNTNRGASQTISANRGHHAFMGSEPRTFTFNYRFVPKDLTELKMVNAIIYTLKVSAVADPVGDRNGYIVQKAPPLVAVNEIVIGQQEEAKQRYTARFFTGVSQIQDVRVTTGGDGAYNTLAGTAGDATVYDVEIVVKELLSPTKAMYDNAARSKNFTADITPERLGSLSRFDLSSKDGIPAGMI